MVIIHNPKQTKGRSLQLASRHLLRCCAGLPASVSRGEDCAGRAAAGGGNTAAARVDARLCRARLAGPLFRRKELHSAAAGKALLSRLPSPFLAMPDISLAQ